MSRVLQIIGALAIAYLVASWIVPHPSPKPDPPGPVDPVKPDPKPEPDFAGYDVKVYDRVMKVKSRTRKAECEQLSADIQKIIEGIGAGTVATNQAVVHELAAALRKLSRPWYPQIKSIADDVLKPLTNDGTLSTPQRWAKLLAQARRGIDRAAAESIGVGDEPAEATKEPEE